MPFEAPETASDREPELGAPVLVPGLLVGQTSRDPEGVSFSRTGPSRDVLREGRETRPDLTSPTEYVDLRAGARPDAERRANAGNLGNGLVAEWQAGFALLSPDEPPCPGLRRWRTVYTAMRAFLDRHADQAAALGWTTLDLFGVHPTAGNVRGDCSGGLTCGRRVTEVQAGRIGFGHLTHYRHPSPGSRVAMWAFGR